MDQIDFVYKENKKVIDIVPSPTHLKSENHPKEVSQLDMTKIEEVGDDEHKIFRKLTHE